MKNKCPQCDYQKLKNWSELSDDEKMVIKAKYSEDSPEERKKHRFCIRCGYEEKDHGAVA